MKKYKVIITSLSVLLIVSLIWGFNQQQAKATVTGQMETKYQQSFYDLIEAMEKLHVSTSKLPILSTDAQIINSLAEVSRQANLGVESLSRLPIYHDMFARTGRFLNQLADYSTATFRRMVNGGELTAKDKETLKAFSEQTKALCQELHTFQDSIANGGTVFYRDDYTYNEETSFTESADPVGYSFSQINSQVEEYPTLIYDGPFSDHMTDRKAENVTGKAISQEEAIAKLEKIKDILHPDRKYHITAEDEPCEAAGIKLYCLQITTENNDGEIISAGVSQAGGHIIILSNSRFPESTNLSEKEALDKAAKFLANLGYKNMQPTYSTIQDNALTAAFAVQENDIMYYPDQVKVKVAMDNGQILGLEAAKYYMAAKDRDLPTPKITMADAEKILNSDFPVESRQLALIPKNDASEVLCYEFRGTYNDETYLVYINVATGQEEEILRVIDTPQGHFTM